MPKRCPNGPTHAYPDTTTYAHSKSVRNRYPGVYGATDSRIRWGLRYRANV